jgi:nitroimidazol reductase NimA-like FMN-containing flavoprotein (pyridoxamine 5'-phosphate oxidase superfamily)
VALSAPDGPHIIPLNYSVVDSAIVVRTSPYSVLGTHGRDAMVAFEVDSFDLAREQGWSVVARGRAEVVRARWPQAGAADPVERADRAPPGQ